MNNIEVHLNNCYGIGSLDHEFNFKDTNTIIIYSPNGTMKSSFAKTFSDLAKDDKKFYPRDRIHQKRPTKCEIYVDSKPINPKSILVIDAEDESFDASNKITNFIASKELKNKYDDIYSELDTKKSEFVKELKKVSQSTDCENEFTNTFDNTKSSFFEALSIIIEILNDKGYNYKFRYNDVFDKKGNVKKFLDKNQSLLTQYIEKYQYLLKESKFFSGSENSFGTYQANEIIRSTKDNSFFEAGHKFLLEGDIYVESSESLQELVEGEISTIINDKELREVFDKVDKAIGANAELRAFKKAIEIDNLLLTELIDYEEFRKKVWISYFSELKKDAIELHEFYLKKKDDLDIIIREAGKEYRVWEDIISKFNARFYVPFDVILTNQEDIILKRETANLKFNYKELNERPEELQKDNLLSILSKGEQRAYYILQLLFEVESRRSSSENLLIFDDIADSFDYKNKYAIIEYIRDLHVTNNFKTILLTHNFDFYRTVTSRLGLGSAVYMSIKDKNREIKLMGGQYRNDVFKYFISKFDDPKIFISLISFVRNIVEYSNSDKCDDYLKLTKCLHLKAGSKELKAGDIFEIFKKYISACKTKTIDFANQKVLDLIHTTADHIIQEKDVNEILLENKIVISISVRLYAEEFMIKKLPDFDIREVNSNQTRALFTEYLKNYSGKETEQLDKVNLMTPENIHLNAFMIEPLIDMSLNHLSSLYTEIKELK